MTSQYRHRRTSSATTAFPNPLEPGEIAVNTANRQIAIGDAQSGVIGQPLPAIAVRYFDIRAQYVANDFVQNGTALYRAKGLITPGPFNITQWDMMVGTFDPQYVAKAGDTMSGMLVLPATAPSIGTHATNKTYVDTGLAGKSTIYSATSPPAGVADNSMWFESDTGLLYIKFNDGSSSQWVIACPQPDISNFVLRSGDNMSGPLGIPLTPTLPAHATSKSYVDAQLAGKSSIIASDTPPVGAIDNSLWYETDSGATYVRYNDLNGGAQWVAIADPAGLVYAAPFDAMAYSGMQVNGSMEVSQELGATEIGLTNAARYVVDSWAVGTNGAQQIYTRQEINPAVGFTKSVLLYANVANTSPAATNYVMLSNPIEGYRISRLSWGTTNAQPITIGFWVITYTPGAYSGSIQNFDTTRSYVFNITTTTAGWEYKTVTIPGCTDGVWKNDNNIGMRVVFCFMSGSTYTSTAGSWLAGNFIGRTGTANGAAVTGAPMAITGVTVLPGIEAPRADRSALIMRPFDQELLTCQRYYQKNPTLFGGWASAADLRTALALAPNMRTGPTCAILNGTNTVERLGVAFLNMTAVSLYTLSTTGGQLSITTTTSLTGALGMVNSGTISLDARL